ncbi:MAG: DUF4150 domain-containing protein [Myxococcota bacterium]
MGDTVFANKQSICSQASSGKAIASMPDVCLTPPPPPAGPLPVPYPNTAMASDLTKGSKDVLVDGKPAALEDSSYLSTSTGDEAGTQGGGVMNSKTKGKAYFTLWSMDVKFEGKGVCRNLDLMQTNGASYPRNDSVPWPFVSTMNFDASGNPADGPCKGVDPALNMKPYNKVSSPDTGHHAIPGRCMKNQSGYSHSKAPTFVASGRSQHMGTHASCHEVFDPFEAACHKRGKTMTYADARKVAANSGKGVNGGKPLTKKERKCVEHQLDNYYKQDDVGVKDSDALRTSGYRGKRVSDSAKQMIDNASISTSKLLKTLSAP